MMGRQDREITCCRTCWSPVHLYFGGDGIAEEW
jgi:hypothetical protein